MHYAFQGVATDALAREFSAHQHVSETATSHMSVYGDIDVALLARAWVHKMQWALDIALGSTTLGHVFTLAELAAYSEPTEFTEFANLATGGAAQRRVQQLRKLFWPTKQHFLDT